MLYMYEWKEKLIYSNIEIASFTKSGSTFYGLTSARTIRQLSSRGFPDKNLHNTKVHSLLASPAWAGMYIILECRSSLQTDILHAYCTV